MTSQGPYEAAKLGVREKQGRMKRHMELQKVISEIENKLKAEEQLGVKQ